MNTFVPESGVQVVSMRNYQSHALTCGKHYASLGQHFRVLPAPDSLDPNVDEALAALHQMEWIGLTDLFHPSLCLLHYQANQKLPEECNCRSPNHHTKNPSKKPLGYWNETRTSRRSLEDLSPRILELLDAHSTVDSQVFSVALKLVLGRLRKVEELTGVSILECIDWQGLKERTDYIPSLWIGSEGSLLKEGAQD